MMCPFCGHKEDRVIDSRESKEGDTVRRRRQCLKCERRFTTYERVDELPFTVVKRSGVKEPFDPEKVRSGVERAVAGSAIEPAAVDNLVAEVEERLRAIGPEVTSEQVGRAVLEGLRRVDPVSYLRFASVYRSFRDINEFMHELKDILNSKEPKAVEAGAGPKPKKPETATEMPKKTEKKSEEKSTKPEKLSLPLDP